MSISVTKIVNLPQAALKFSVADDFEDLPTHEWKTNGGVLSDSDYAWLSRGPRLEIVHTKRGHKVGDWTFGSILKDSNIEVVCVDEIQRPNGRLPLLAVGLDCAINGGMICIFDFVTSKVIRAILINDKISDLHVIDAGFDVFMLPGPLRSFDGIIAAGTLGGDLLLVDICREICDEALTGSCLSEIRDELNPCLLCKITSKDLDRIEHHKQFAVRNSHHLAIHLNIVFDRPQIKHFTLKGPKGDDRIHVNKSEVAVSALYYCPQLGSLLAGYNFGAFQLYNLMNLELLYTSPVSEEHIPITHFVMQEPADDPRAVCYVWAVYSADEQYRRCLPLAVMYAFCYESKEYHEGYGCLYQDFGKASIHYQMELAVPYGHDAVSKPRGGICVKVSSINQGLINREGRHHDSNEDILTLCMFVWNVYYSNEKSDTFLSVFDLNQWYKEQMPRVANPEYFSTYMLQIHLSDLMNSSTHKSALVLDVHIHKNSIQQFTGAQRLEEHFYPNSVTFDVTCLRDEDVIFLKNYGVQKALLARIESAGPLCLVEPAEIYQDVIGLGVVPLFIDLPVNSPISTNQQREIILGAALENHLMGWLCKCASEWANGSFLAAGCSLDLLISWAFQRAIVLKENCDKFCTSLFDFSEVRLDTNTNTLLNSCARQLKNLYSLYSFIIKKLWTFISNPELITEQYKSLETVPVYFEVLQWLLNVGLLPECPLAAYPRSDDLERISAPYPVETLTEFYNHRRALLKILNEENFSSSESTLFIDALIERECGGNILQEQWRNDGGNGFYPPPSLQSLLRTYLINDVELPYKHSVIIYVFLDLAMTLDQDKYKSVITYLIKFPAVFKVSPSLIKITQAFWQLDHTDYNAAMGLLLDPLIASKDLSHWHHKIVLKALILQKQHNLALLYVQVKKPPFKDDDDIVTAISLYVANNMLDEAFYFVKHCNSQIQENIFLLHLLKECTKYDKLQALIYRSLDTREENFFLKYLTECKQTVTEDLLVYYQILRSHLLEAFESHGRTVHNQIENQGLVGQENAVPREKLIHCLKNILPDISRNLISICHKENSNSWQRVTKPTPMSVFVHNYTENVQCKSTLVGAALGKAKQTFSDTVNRKYNMETEETPFLRTPRAIVGSKRSSAVLVNPKIIDVDVDADTTAPAAKRLKISPRLNATGSDTIMSKLDTPLVKRETQRLSDGAEERKVATPHSILKVKRLVNYTPSKRDDEFEDDFKEFEKVEYTPVTSKKSAFDLSPRKPLVRFEGLKGSSPPSTLNNTLGTDKTYADKSINASGRKSLSPIPTLDSVNVSPTNTSAEDEVFYSPETSLEEKEENKTSEPEREVVEEKLVSEIENKDEMPREITESCTVFSPRGRRSYKQLPAQTTSVTSSPRSRIGTVPKESLITSKIIKIQTSDSPIKSKLAKDSDSLTSHVVETQSEELLNESEKSSPALPKLRPRKSLCRQVLETNALNRVMKSPLDYPKSRRSKKIEISQVVENTKEEFLESQSKYEDGVEIQKSSFVRKQNTTTSFVESDLDSSSSEFNLSLAEAPLSESMLSYIHNSHEDVSIDNSSSAKSEVSTTQDNLTINNTDEGNVSENRTNTNANFDKNVPETSSTHMDHKDSKAGEKSAFEKPALDAEVDPNRPTEQKNEVNTEVESRNKELENELVQTKFPSGYKDAHSAMDQSKKSIADSVFDSSSEISSVPYDASGLKLSESLLQSLYNTNFGDDSHKTQSEEPESMEVDDEVELIDESKVNEEKNSRDEPTYSVITISDASETRKGELAISKQNKTENNVEKSVEEMESNRPLDPEMNVFEISDDLSYNEELVVEKEVALEESDLSYNILEENIGFVNSTPLKALEKNVFNIKGEKEESDVDEHNEDVDKPEGNHPGDEVIEIGSSSEESELSESENSSLGDSSGDKQDFSYKRNIYDTEGDYSSESSHYSEISENSDDEHVDETKEGYGLFQGDILYPGEEEVKGDKRCDSSKDEYEDAVHEQRENEESKLDTSADSKQDEVVEKHVHVVLENQPIEIVDESCQIITETVVEDGEGESCKQEDEVVEKRKEVSCENQPKAVDESYQVTPQTIVMQHTNENISVEMDELNYSVQSVHEDETKEGCGGLFQGDILYLDEEEVEDDKCCDSSKDEYEEAVSEQRENEESKLDASADSCKRDEVVEKHVDAVLENQPVEIVDESCQIITETVVEGGEGRSLPEEVEKKLDESCKQEDEVMEKRREVTCENHPEAVDESYQVRPVVSQNILSAAADTLKTEDSENVDKEISEDIMLQKQFFDSRKPEKLQGEEHTDNSIKEDVEMEATVDPLPQEPLDGVDNLKTQKNLKQKADVAKETTEQITQIDSPSQDPSDQMDNLLTQKKIKKEANNSKGTTQRTAQIDRRSQDPLDRVDNLIKQENLEQKANVAMETTQADPLFQDPLDIEDNLSVQQNLKQKPDVEMDVTKETIPENSLPQDVLDFQDKPMIQENSEQKANVATTHEDTITQDPLDVLFAKKIEYVEDQSRRPRARSASVASSTSARSIKSSNKKKG